MCYLILTFWRNLLLQSANIQFVIHILSWLFTTLKINIVFVINFSATCSNEKCLWTKKYEYFRIIGKKKRDEGGRNFYDINLRTAFREIAKGHSDIETFCRCINMPPPMTKESYEILYILCCLVMRKLFTSLWKKQQMKLMLT